MCFAQKQAKTKALWTDWPACFCFGQDREWSSFYHMLLFLFIKILKPLWIHLKTGKKRIPVRALQWAPPAWGATYSPLLNPRSKSPFQMFSSSNCLCWVMFLAAVRDQWVNFHLGGVENVVEVGGSDGYTAAMGPITLNCTEVSQKCTRTVKNPTHGRQKPFVPK